MSITRTSTPVTESGPGTAPPASAQARGTQTTSHESRLSDVDFSSSSNGSYSAKEIHRDIDQTRQEMDDTLDAIAERLHPRHLLDDALAYFRSSSDGSSDGDTMRQAKSAGRQVIRKVKQRQVPALLCAAGLAWWLYDELSEDEEPGHIPHRQPRTTGAAAWESDYDWTHADETEDSWYQRASQTLTEARKKLTDQSVSAKDRIKATSASLMGISGRKRREIHERWADLQIHSGSVVDARTGEPYDDHYGEEYSGRETGGWKDLKAIDFFASHNWSSDDEERWTATAEQKLAELDEQLSSAAGSVRKQASTIARTLSDLAASTGDSAVSGSRSAAAAVQSGARASVHSTRQAGRQLGRQVSSGYEYSRDRLTEAIEEHPLAVGAAALGLGLLAGALLPETSQEDRWMGEASDDVARQAREMATDAARRGKDVAEQTLDEAGRQFREQGLAPDQLAGKAGEAAKNVSREARENVEKHSSDMTDCG